ncbi:pilus assembly PilX N-terminal domain-containing protein [Patescibacteria group bacterium]|nr:hypothetical protein [Candidatus Falkowbacteria bacterium]MBU3906125.1 pilus assembly PilX N-terminal domain-containing protein [Patescibacteria group bacterium]MBU4015521.1 pilus assembly PilX N-terminal domain-containing protein [Patescibacteria group bacterium]MBU4026073.1 pilus assembly PilX N-terminal domain-containing protein [Patescibacteria group bacterium]MBU4072630.1 pilus assembly PilX N-terminal domain-containing protein [Patescibacteria group bacterium]
MRMNIIKNKNGTALMMALLILTSILAVSLGAAKLVMSGLKMSGTQERSAIAYFAAEAGIERVLREIRKNGFSAGDCDAATNQYVDFSADPAECDSNDAHSELLTNNASFKVIYTSDSPRTFVSIGEYTGVRRVVEISY